MAATLGVQTMRVVEQNKAIVVTPNVAAIAYGAVAVLNPIAGVLINNGVAMVAALNSLRPLNIAQRQAVPVDAQLTIIQPPVPMAGQKVGQTVGQTGGGEDDAPAQQGTYQAQFAA